MFDNFSGFGVGVPDCLVDVQCSSKDCQFTSDIGAVAFLDLIACTHGQLAGFVARYRRD
jgi:hypothetical protein